MNDNEITPIKIDGQILKFTMPKQFTSDEILNKEDRLVRGWTSVEVKDNQGDIVPIESLRKTMNTWMSRGAFITDQHSNRVVGKGLRWYEDTHEKTKKQGIVIDYQIFKDYSVDDTVWDEIKSGKRKGLSFGGRAMSKPTEKIDSYTGEKASNIGAIETYEMASVIDPANKFAENTMVNFMAKSNKNDNDYVNGLIKSESNKLTEDLQKGYDVVDTEKEFAGFKNFDVCVVAQTKRGHNEESSKRICGWLKSRYENTDTKDTKKSKGQTRKDIEQLENFKVIESINRGKQGYYELLFGANEYFINDEGVIIWSSGNSSIKDVETKWNETTGRTISIEDWIEDDTKKTKPLKGKENIKDVGAITMSDDKTKQDEIGDKKPEDQKPSEENKQNDTSVTLSDISAKIDKLIDAISSASKQKASEDTGDKKPEDETKGDTSKEEDEKPPKEDEDEDKSKVDDEKKPDEDKSDSKKTDSEVSITKQNVDAIVEKQLQEKLKSMGITNVTKATTPRVSQPDVTKKEKTKDPTIDMLDKVKSGKLDIGKMNQEVRKMCEEEYDKNLKAVLDS